MNRDQLFDQLSEYFQSLHRAILRKKGVGPHSLPYGQKAALMTIADHKQLNIKKLATCLSVTSGAVTQHVEALVQDGLVERLPDPEDRRTVIVRLSEAGETLISQLRHDRLILMKELFNDVPTQDLKAFNAVMKKVHDSINTQGDTKHDKHDT